MTEPRNCDWFALISGAMSPTEREVWRQLLSCRPENCTHTALHLVQKLYTLLIYQGVGAFKPLFNSLLLLKTLSASNNTGRAVLVAADFTGGGRKSGWGYYQDNKDELLHKPIHSQLT